MKIVSIKKATTEKVYDISIDEVEHYILENGVVTHNSAMQYAASSIVFLSKRKEKDGTEVIGNIIHCKMNKSRLTKENKMVDVLLTYSKGLSKYYGLVELAEAAGVFKKVSTRIELPDGTKIFSKQILKDPQKYFTEDVLTKIDEYTKVEYTYGRTEDDDGDAGDDTGGDKESL